MRLLSSAPCRRCQLSSNVRHQILSAVAWSAEALLQFGRVQPVKSHLYPRKPVRRLALFGCVSRTNYIVHSMLCNVSASRAAFGATHALFVGQFVGPAAVATAKAAISLDRGGRQAQSAQKIGAARSGLQVLQGSKKAATGGKLQLHTVSSHLMPNPSFKPTRYGRQRKPGVRRLRHLRTPALRRLPQRAA